MISISYSTDHGGGGSYTQQYLGNRATLTFSNHLTSHGNPMFSEVLADT